MLGRSSISVQAITPARMLRSPPKAPIPRSGFVLGREAEWRHFGGNGRKLPSSFLASAPKNRHSCVDPKLKSTKMCAGASCLMTAFSMGSMSVWGQPIHADDQSPQFHEGRHVLRC
jgi:hypothetical protein